MRAPGAGVVSVISHLPQAEKVTVSARADKLGLRAGQPLYVWLYRMNDIRQAQPAYPMGLTRELYRKSG